MIRYKQLILKPTMKSKLLFLSALVFASCGTYKPNNLGPSDFNIKMTSANSKIIDVRSAEEFKEGYIKGAVNIDFYSENFENEMNKFDKGETLYLYCLSGNRSGQASEKLSKLGFKNIYSLEGGIKAWKANNLPLELNTSNDKDSVGATTANTEKDPTDFKTAIYGNKLVFVDFNAVWCGPCKKMQPFVDMLKEERSKEVIVFSIDTDEQVALAQEYQIVNLPTVVLIKNGAVLYRKEGYHNQQSLNELVTKFK